MCGITGIYAFNEVGRINMINISAATNKLSSRGPNQQGSFIEQFVGLGHCRLSILDLSENGRQPMYDAEQRYVIVYNGEIYNFKILKKELERKGYKFNSGTDTEVLLKLFIEKGADCLHDLQGFFAFAIYDKVEKILFLARDRMGIKPLYFYHDEDKFLFASELKSILAYGIKKEMDYDSLYHYFQLNYIPAPHSIFKKVKKVMPGHLLKIQNSTVTHEQYYKIPYDKDRSNDGGQNYLQQQKKLKELLHAAVKKRLVADVPVGAFLSGGIDSSIISSIASQYTDHLKTFSIGFKDEPFFDETRYAHLVAKKLKTEHTTFSLSNQDLLKHLYDILDYIDEPFADSSAILVYILSKNTKETATVALSGDGADEMFSGYNKHTAFYKARQGGIMSHAVKALSPLWSALPKSRNSGFSNKIRQLNRFTNGLKLQGNERYWAWASLAEGSEIYGLFNDKIKENISNSNTKNRIAGYFDTIPDRYEINDILYADMQLVLPNDMLTKVDLMSMANSLEVRVPFLDHDLVEFAFQLPESSKIDKRMKKKILQDTFRDDLPPELYNRPKKGFEVPLLKWFRNELRSLIQDDLLEDSFIERQNIFDLSAIKQLKVTLYSGNPGDVHARIWALIVFQYWWKKHYA